MNIKRIEKLISDAIDAYDLDLSGLTVFTEAASGNYVVTPLIAALAGSDRVFAITRDSGYGTAVDIRDFTLELAKRWGVGDRIEVVSNKIPSMLSQVDIVTNLGFVRPIDKSMIAHLKPTAVLPLMWETWEFREADLDLAECRWVGIMVLGTNEREVGLDLFTYVGYLAVKLAFELEIEIYRSTVVVVGSGFFGESSVKAFDKLEADIKYIDLSAGASLETKSAKSTLRDADLVVLVEHHSPVCLIGSEGQITVDELLALSPHMSIIHIAGNINRKEIDNAAIPCLPQKSAAPGYMSVTTDHLGPKPVITLHTAGLKVGEAMARARLAGFNPIEAEKKVLHDLPFAMGFGPSHKYMQTS
ncbi:hypothetical protein C6496_20105 [Candidatus Poribacteria bacterium]|nr:MAG: hypothetical protein C6496_20105 [Candidatus Poribacteria bacterium]